MGLNDALGSELPCLFLPKSFAHCVVSAVRVHSQTITGLGSVTHLHTTLVTIWRLVFNSSLVRETPAVMHCTFQFSKVLWQSLAPRLCKGVAAHVLIQLVRVWLGGAKFIFKIYFFYPSSRHLLEVGRFHVICKAFVCCDLRSEVRCCLLRRTLALSRLLGHMKSNDYLVMLFYARIIGRDGGCLFFCVRFLVRLALVFCPTLLFRCSLCIHLFLIDKGQEVNALPRGSRPQTFFFSPPPPSFSSKLHA